ncbi:MAG: DUF4214 domain-containing protein [Pseudomonadota bacterium]
MTDKTIEISDFRDAVSNFADFLDGDSDLVDAVQTVTSSVDFGINLPGRIEFSMRVFQDGLTLPNAVTAALSFAPFGIGTAVRKTDQVADRVVDRLEPTRQKLEEADTKLKPFIEQFSNVSTAASAIKYTLDGAVVMSENLLDTADYILDALTAETAPEGSRLAERLDTVAEFLGDFNDFHDDLFNGAKVILDDVAAVIDETVGSLPVGVIDDALETVGKVFSPVSNALQSVEDALCKTFTVVPGVPALYGPNPIAFLPGQPDRIQITPAIPALRVNVCDVIETLGNQIGIVQDFVENLILDVLSKLGLDLRAAVDALEGKLMAPFSDLLEAVANMADRIDHIADVVAEAIQKVGDFFADLGDRLRDAIDQVVLFEAGQVGDESPDGNDDVLFGRTQPDQNPLAPSFATSGVTDEVEDGIFGRTGNDELYGLGGDDFLFGGEGEDTLDGGTGDDENYGGEGDDTYVFTGDFGDDFVSDEAGASTLQFDAGTEISYSQQANGDLLIETANGTVRVDGFYEGDQRATTTIRVGETESKINTAPTALALAGAAVAEDAAVGAVVGRLSATDADGDALSYRLTEDAGGRFAIEGNQLVVAAGLDFETASSHSLTIEADDGYGGTVSQTVSVNVEDVFEPGLPPEALALNGQRVAEDAAPGTEVGRLSATDPEGETLSYSLVDDAEGRFALDGARLMTADSFDFETQSSHEITVEVSDPAGNTDVERFDIAVTDVAEAPGSGPEPVLPGEPAPLPEPVPTPGLEPVNGTNSDDAFALDAAGGRFVMGQGGTDTVRYPASRSDVQDEANGSGGASIQLPGGMDMLDSVERVELDDGTLLFDLRDDAAFTYRLYAASLGRTPDEGGLRFWDGQLEAGMSQKALAQAFVDSPEFSQRFGGEDPSDEDYVDALYTNVLGRDADGGGKAFWEDALGDGRIGEADTLIAFANSPENMAKTADDYDDGVWVV